MLAARIVQTWTWLVNINRTFKRVTISRSQQDGITKFASIEHAGRNLTAII